MADTQVGQVAISADIPKALEEFYVGSGKPGEAGYVPGLIDLGKQAIFPTGPGGEALTGAAAYQQMYQPLVQAGLVGAGSVAGLSPFQQEVGRGLSQMATPEQFALGTQAGQAAAGTLQGLAGLQAPAISPARQFTSAEAQQYMSPYMQSVVDMQQRKAIDAAKQAQLGQNLASARQGTYGGARQTLLQGSREAGLRQQLGDIQTTGLQAAYDQAAQQFERDRAAQLGVSQANQAAALQAAQTRLGAGQGLTALGSSLGGLGTAQQAADIDRLKTIGAFGDLQRGVTQQAMDAQRQYLGDQALFGQQQVGQFSNLLRGIPMTSQTQTTTTPAPSFASQLTGLGLTGLGIYNMLNPAG